MLIAGFNLFIGMFNFIPLLPLDGGHIAGALWEAVRRGVARLRGRPDPGYVDVAKLLPIAYGVAVVLLVMGVVLIVGDLVVPLHITRDPARPAGHRSEHDRDQPGHARRPRRPCSPRAARPARSRSARSASAASPRSRSSR